MYSCWLLEAAIGKCGGILSGEFEMYSCWLLDTGLRPLLAPLFASNDDCFFLLSTFDF